MSYFKKFSNTTSTPAIEVNAPIHNGVPKTGDVGIEIEIEGRGIPSEFDLAGIRGPNKSTYWRQKADGSLRGEAAEYVFSEPTDIDTAEVLINGLYTKFSENGTKLLLSNRCSTHVHLNVSSWKIDKLSSFVVLWAMLETALIEWCGVRRKTNHFCPSIDDNPESIEAWIEFLTTGRYLFHDGAKYAALNFLRLWDFGSFEIRCGEAYASPVPVIKWMKFLHALKTLAGSLESPADIPSLVSEKTPSGIFRDICLDTGLEDFYQEVMDANKDFDKTALRGYRNAQKLCYGIPWGEWRPLIDRVRVVNPFGTTKVNRAPPMPRLRIDEIAPRTAILEAGEPQIRIRTR